MVLSYDADSGWKKIENFNQWGEELDEKIIVWIIEWLIKGLFTYYKGSFMRKPYRQLSEDYTLWQIRAY